MPEDAQDNTSEIRFYQELLKIQNNSSYLMAEFLIWCSSAGTQFKFCHSIRHFDLTLSTLHAICSSSL